VWAAIRSVGAVRRSPPVKCDLDPNVLNEHYTCVAKVTYPNEIQEGICRYKNMECENRQDKFYFSYVLPEDVIKSVNSISSKAQGVDGISITMIKQCLVHIIPCLCHIFDHCLQYGVFPSIWKMAQVIPIPKKKEPVDPRDFRPVSLISVLAKICEKIVFSQINKYLSEKNILSSAQSGFRKGHSTTTTLIKTTDEIRAAIDNRELSLMILFDFSKAFEKVHHNLLIVKLKSMGFSRAALSWFEAYLTSRQQRVLVDQNKFSSWTDLDTGIPQGSVMGPLLYSLYVNDLDKIFKHGSVHLYADDLRYTIAFKPGQHEEAIRIAENDIELLKKYAVEHNLDLNIEKTQPMFLGSRKYLNSNNISEATPITVENVQIPYVSHACYLGVEIDQTLCWSFHVDNLCKKILSNLCQLRRKKDSLPSSIRQKIVNSVICPNFDYGAIVMSDMHAENKLKLQRLQNVCVRFILDVRKYDHVTPYYTQLNWFKLDKRRVMSTASLLFNMIKSQTPMYLFNTFKLSSQVNSRKNRLSDRMLIIPVHRTEKYGHSFTIIASKIWNKYKMYDLITLNYHCFKKRMKDMVLREL